MNKFQFKTYSKKILADTITPVSIYLKIRDKFPNSMLFEGSDSRGSNNSFSYICFNPIATILVENEEINLKYPNNTEKVVPITPEINVPDEINKFASQFSSAPNPYGVKDNGLFGYISYDGVRYFEDININKKDTNLDVPDIVYSVFQFLIAIDHFKNEAYLFSHHLHEDEPNPLGEIEAIINAKVFPSYNFETTDERSSSLTDREYIEAVKFGKNHCHRGDVFQIVLSRRFIQPFKGDDFNVYRALRSLNPSPYLFYLDYGNFKIFGSSPEAQLIIEGDKATINPIAGTFKRTGNDLEDSVLAKQLSNDPKENAEHIMLVDLARNDLSRFGKEVTVETYKEVQYFSHVIHLVSTVVAKRSENTHSMSLVASTFPAGTLSGAPKHRAMQLIEKYERDSRGIYGGAVGFMDFNGNFNQAIIIRSFLSKDNTLYYQAGAGIVAASNEESELQEVYNKVAALENAVENAKDIN